jgi:beta-glucosidase/6-phospho-beta-glucosidase/beta-galactosidase
VRDDPQAGDLGYAHERPEGEYTHTDWEVHPDSLRCLLERLHAEYASGVLYITENGAACPDEIAPTTVFTTRIASATLHVIWSPATRQLQLEFRCADTSSGR